MATRLWGRAEIVGGVSWVLWAARVAGRCLCRCHRRWRQRVHLSDLDARALRDIGVTRADAIRESRRAFWR